MGRRLWHSRARRDGRNVQEYSDRWCVHFSLSVCVCVCVFVLSQDIIVDSDELMYVCMCVCVCVCSCVYCVHSCYRRVTSVQGGEEQRVTCGITNADAGDAAAMPTTRVDLLRMRRPIPASGDAFRGSSTSTCSRTVQLNSKSSAFGKNDVTHPAAMTRPAPLPPTTAYLPPPSGGGLDTGLSSSASIPTASSASSSVHLNEQRQRPVSARSRPHSNKRFLERYNLQRNLDLFSPT